MSVVIPFVSLREVAGGSWGNWRSCDQMRGSDAGKSWGPLSSRLIGRMKTRSHLYPFAEAVMLFLFGYLHLMP
jgi:hypothetical protein